MTKLTEIKSEWEYKITQADLLNGWTTSLALPLIREGNEVTLLLTYGGLNGSAQTSTIFANIPLGYRPRDMGNYGTLGHVSEGKNPVQVRKDFNRLSCEGRGAVSGIVKWLTSEAPPPLLSKLLGLVWGQKCA